MTELAAAAPQHVAILGAGPIGLDAALAAVDRGWSFTIYESASAVGANVRAWGHVRLFTPWSMNVSDRMRAHLGAEGIAVPSSADCPLGRDLVTDVLEPVAALPEVAPYLRLGTRVQEVGREGLLKHERIGSAARSDHPFRLLVTAPDGVERIEHADLVLDCTGTYATPNALGDGGIMAPGERALSSRIIRTLPDLAVTSGDWAGGTTLLVGAGKSAQTAARDLSALAAERPATTVVWAIRDQAPTWGAVADDSLPQRQALVDCAHALLDGDNDAVEVRTGVAVEALGTRAGRIVATLRGAAGSSDVVVDHVLSLTGSVPDAGLYRQLQVHECYATAAPMALSAALLGAAGEGGGDCLVQQSVGVDVLRSPEPDFFILGAKSYGRNSAFLLRIGYAQVDEVTSAYPGGLAPVGSGGAAGQERS